MKIDIMKCGSPNYSKSARYFTNADVSKSASWCKCFFHCLIILDLDLC